MLTKIQKQIVFYVFIIIVGISVILETVLIFKIGGDVNYLKNIFWPLVGSTGCILFSITIFFKLFKDNFQTVSLPYILKELNIERIRSIHTDNCIKCTGSLLNSSLRFSEHILKKEFGEEVDFEISVFYNQQEPDIVYYYDSRGQSFPSSTNNRKTNPNYYIEKGYAVVEFMRNPCAEVVVFDDICKYSYSFTNNQKSRIKSQAMFYMSHEGPYVLVIASNHKKTFDPKNKRSLQLVEALGNYIKSDVLLSQTMENCS